MIDIKPYGTKAAKASARISHVTEHAADPIWEGCAELILNSQQSEWGRTSLLTNHAQASASRAWFVNGDLKAFRQWCYLSTRLMIRMEEYAEDFGQASNAIRDLLYPFASNDEAVIHDFANCNRFVETIHVDRPTTYAFYRHQYRLALFEDWKTLASRAEKFIATPPKHKFINSTVADNRFLLALCHRDSREMQAILNEMVTPAFIRSRNSAESGYTEDLVSSSIFVLCKLALRQGINIKVDSPYVPAAWLPLDPLPEYEDVYEFLKRPFVKPVALVSP